MGVRKKTYVAGIISCFPNVHSPPPSPTQAKAPLTIELDMPATHILMYSCSYDGTM